MAGQGICALGDLLLDVIVRLDGPIAEDTDTYGATRVGAGGQAANVAAWAAELGAPARFLGKRAVDAAGRIAAEELEARGVALVGPVVAAGTGTVVSIATPDGRRTMLTDRGVAVEFAPEELDSSWLGSCTWLHVPGYSLARSPLAETTLEVAATAERVSFDVSSTTAMRELGLDVFRERVTALGPSLVFATEAEAELLGEVRAQTTVIKRGAKGCVVRSGNGERAHAARPARVLDTTGAGDAFAAGYLVGGPALGLEAAARCVAKLGAMP